MGAITSKIFELFESGNNIEQQRTTGIIIEANWFDAIDGRTTTGDDTKEGGGAKNALPNIQVEKSKIDPYEKDISV